MTISEWQEGDVYFSDYHYCNITVTELSGSTTVKIDVLRFNYDEKTTSIADSFVIPVQETATTGTTPTGSPVIPVALPLVPVFLGLIVIISIRKGKEMY